MEKLILGQLSDSEGTGFRFHYTNPEIAFGDIECNIWVNKFGDVQISNKVSKSQFLDLMSKLYDMAEVK